MSVVSPDRRPVNIDDDAEVISEQVEALKALGQKDPSDGEIYDFSIRWGAALAGRLPRLLHYHSLGLLDGADERRFHELCDELRELSGLVEKLSLVRPVLPGDEAASVSGHRHLATWWRALQRRPRS
ncbi:MAG TPA: hypothetical protein VME67_25405 [Mycobacterium sp.]|nr:hypothetical protein [Mycobacterium sp.]HTX97880.1 hypothetical protein [Mycobacterium sp.]